MDTIKQDSIEQNEVEEDDIQIEQNQKGQWKQTWNRLIACIAVPVFLELLFRLFVFPESEASLLYPIYISVLAGMLLYFLTSLFPKKANRVLFTVFLFVFLIYYAVQLIYHHVFLVFFSFSSVTAVGGDVLEFRKQIFHAIQENWLGLLLFVLAVVSVLLFSLRFVGFTRKKAEHSLAFLSFTILCYFGFRFLLPVGGTEEFTAYELYEKDWVQEFGAEQLGMVVLAQKDVTSLLFGGRASGGGDVVIIERPTYATPTPTLPSPTPTEAAAVTVTQGPSPTATPSPSPTPTPIDTSPNVLDIDFSALAEAESNAEIKKLHNYFASEEVTLKNEYTGMFEGYNLIMLTAEGFSPYAIVPGLTPTLEMLSTTGFVFENFYSPIWNTSTIDGEFINCTGLLPDEFYSLRRMIGHDMRFCFGHMFGELGYLTNAYHNHSYKYYQRNKTHPSMGYNYKGRGNGLEVASTWPESDLEMMELSIPEYIDAEPFHVYYMTVSGHMEYTFNDNRMAYNNRSAVADLPYSSEARAYIACNYELEKALTYLIEQLEAAGVAERTVIALATDHYPYGLEKKFIDELAGHEVEENFELYESTFILWSPSMKEPVYVDKYCSALDIAPTIANLFGLEYDSRLYMGKDILSTNEGLVIFNNRSFITDRMMYNSRTKETTLLTEEELPEDYLKTMIQIVRNRFTISKGIIDLDYYSYLPKQEKENGLQTE